MRGGTRLVLLELRVGAAGEAEGVEELAAGVAVGHALEVVGDAKEGAVALAARVLVVRKALGLRPRAQHELDEQQRSCAHRTHHACAQRQVVCMISPCECI